MKGIVLAFYPTGCSRLRQQQMICGDFTQSRGQGKFHEPQTWENRTDPDPGEPAGATGTASLPVLSKRTTWESP